MKGRIFTFGCSYTNYEWPTWADIILYDNKGYNFGLPGAGYDHLLYTILDVDRKLKFTEYDVIIIVLTQPIRFDILINNSYGLDWISKGNAISNYYKYVDKIFSVDGLLFKAYNNIILIDQYLKNKKLNYVFGSLSNLFETPEGNDNNLLKYTINETKELVNYVKQTVEIKLMSFDDFIIKILKNTNNNTKVFKEYTDGHPRPITYFKWVNDILLKSINIEVKAKIEDIINIEKIIDDTIFVDDLISLKNNYPKFFSNRYNNHSESFIESINKKLL